MIGDVEMAWFKKTMEQAAAGALVYDGFRLVATGKRPKFTPDFPPEPPSEEAERHRAWERVCAALQDDAGVYEVCKAWRLPVTENVSAMDLAIIADRVFSEKVGLKEWDFTPSPDLTVEGSFGLGVGWIPLLHRLPDGVWMEISLVFPPEKGLPPPLPRLTWLERTFLTLVEKIFSFLFRRRRD